MKYRFKTFTTVFLSLFVSSSLAYGQNNTNASKPTFKFYSIYSDLGTFYEGLAPVKQTSKDFALGVTNKNLGYINENGKLVIDYQYSTDRNYSDPYRCDYYVEMPPPLENYHKPSKEFTFRNGYATVFIDSDERTYHIDKNGKIIDNTFSGKYYYAGPFIDGIALAQQTYHGLFGYIDKNGKPITEFKYLQASHFKNGVAKVVSAVPFNNGLRYYPPQAFFFPSEDSLIGFYPVRAQNIPPDKDIVDQIIDKTGNVLYQKYHEQDRIDQYFRRSIINLDDIWEGLSVQNNMDQASHSGDLYTRWYNDIYGEPVIKYKGIQLFNACDFTPDQFAKIEYFDLTNEDDINIMKTGYIDKDGKFIDMIFLKNKYPNLKTIIRVMMDDNGNGYGCKIIKNGEDNILIKYNTDGSYGEDYTTCRERYLLIDADGLVLYDCTQEIINGLIEIYSKDVRISLEESKKAYEKGDMYRYIISKPVENSNIFYIGRTIYMGTREFFENVAFFKVEGW